MEFAEETQGTEDAEGEEVDGEEGDDGEDKELYCFCQKLSYGEMIACDNAGCPYQWVSIVPLHRAPLILVPVPLAVREFKAAVAGTMVLRRMHQTGDGCHFQTTDWQVEGEGPCPVLHRAWRMIRRPP